MDFVVYQQPPLANNATEGRSSNDFLRLSLNDRTFLFLVFLLDKKVSSVG